MIWHGRLKGNAQATGPRHKGNSGNGITATWQRSGNMTTGPRQLDASGNMTAKATVGSDDASKHDADNRAKRMVSSFRKHGR